jgi:hypothetical protein
MDVPALERKLVCLVYLLSYNSIFQLDVHRRWDLWWAPVWAGSYWTSSVQYRALRAGARLCRLIGRETDDHRYDGVASMVLEYAQESTPSPLNSGELKHFNLVDFLERRERIYDRDDYH